MEKLKSPIPVIFRIKKYPRDKIEIFFSDMTVFSMEPGNESMYIEEITGDFKDLMGRELLLSECYIVHGIECILYKFASMEKVVGVEWVSSSLRYTANFNTTSVNTKIETFNLKQLTTNEQVEWDRILETI
jgi:hypothetical protein